MAMLDRGEVRIAALFIFYSVIQFGLFNQILYNNKISLGTGKM